MAQSAWDRVGNKCSFSYLRENTFSFLRENSLRKIKKHYVQMRKIGVCGVFVQLTILQYKKYFKNGIAPSELAVQWLLNSLITFFLVRAVHDSTFLKNKRIAPIGFMVYFYPAEKKRVSSLHTYVTLLCHLLESLPIVACSDILEQLWR